MYSFFWAWITFEYEEKGNVLNEWLVSKNGCFLNVFLQSWPRLLWSMKRHRKENIQLAGDIQCTSNCIMHVCSPNVIPYSNVDPSLQTFFHHLWTARCGLLILIQSCSSVPAIPDPVEQLSILVSSSLMLFQSQWLMITCTPVDVQVASIGCRGSALSDPPDGYLTVAGMLHTMLWRCCETSGHGWLWSELWQVPWAWEIRTSTMREGDQAVNPHSQTLVVTILAASEIWELGAGQILSGDECHAISIVKESIVTSLRLENERRMPLLRLYSPDLWITTELSIDGPQKYPNMLPWRFIVLGPKWMEREQ